MGSIKTNTSRGDNPLIFLTKLCPIFDLEFSKCSFSRALAPACGALVAVLTSLDMINCHSSGNEAGCSLSVDVR